MHGVRSRSRRSVQVEGHSNSVPTNPDANTWTTTSFIAARGSGRSSNFIPAVPRALSTTTIALIATHGSKKNAGTRSCGILHKRAYRAGQRYRHRVRGAAERVRSVLACKGVAWQPAFWNRTWAQRLEAPHRDIEWNIGCRGRNRRRIDLHTAATANAYREVGIRHHLRMIACMQPPPDSDVIIARLRHPAGP